MYVPSHNLQVCCMIVYSYYDAKYIVYTTPLQVAPLYGRKIDQTLKTPEAFAVQTG